jgi:hypothetical protein
LQLVFSCGVEKQTHRRFVFDWLMSCLTYNLILNHASLPRCFSCQDCKMENAFFIGIGPRI